jgi:hypothetical protein
MKKAFDVENLPDSVKEDSAALNKAVFARSRGIAGDPLLEPIPKYLEAENEQVFQGNNNTYIVLGRDRPSSRISGYGGKGHTQCGSIDIVVGRMAHKPKHNVWVDPNFSVDAARIYISQKTDIDKNFNLADGKMGPAEAKSGIGIKADGVRIIGREGIKLVTGTDGLNSQGGSVDTTFGIDIIAGNNDEGLQPMVKGTNLAIALDRMTKHLEKLSGIVSAFLKTQSTYNTAIAGHFHISPFYGSPTTPSSIVSQQAGQTSMNLLNDCVLGLQKFKTNLVNYRQTYLKPHGDKYINSRYNNVN